MRITGNHASQGGGIIATRSTSVVLEQTLVSNNTADQVGGGIANFPVVGTATVLVDNSTISGNSQTAPQDPATFDYGGGGISNGNGDVTLVHATITKNHAAAHGGGVQLDFGAVHTKDSIISGNTSDTPGESNC